MDHLFWPTLISGGLFFSITAAWHYFSSYSKAMIAIDKAKLEGRTPPEEAIEVVRAGPIGNFAWIWAVVCAIMLGSFGMLWAWLIVGLLFFWKLGMPIVRAAGLVAWWLLGNRVERRIVGLLNAGNVDGALEFVRSEIEIKGPSALLHNAWRVCLLRQGKPEEALGMFERATRAQGGGAADPVDKITAEPTTALVRIKSQVDAVYLNNTALALKQLGRLPEALRCLEEVQHRYPDDLFAACNVGLLALDLNRLDQATDMLRVAEDVFAKVYVVDSRLRQQRKRILHDLRERVSQCRPGEEEKRSS
jgi:tetratricopeptide (TPR) repeat protein